MANLDMPSSLDRPELRETRTFAPAEIGVAILFGALVAASPISTSNRLFVKIAFGVVAATGLYLYRSIAARGPDARAPDASSNTSKLSSRANPTFWISALLLVVTFVPAARMLMPWYLDSVWQHGHGILLPLLIAAVTAAILERKPLDPNESTAWGLLPIALGLALILLDFGMKTLHASVFGLTIAAAGLVMLHFGWKGVSTLAAPIAMLLFFAPLPTVLANDLSMSAASAAGAESILRPLGVPTSRLNVTIQTFNMEFAISSRCSGFGALYGAVALAVAFGAAVGSWKRTVALLLVAWPLVIVANAIRLVLLLAFCSLQGVNPNHTSMHGLSGILAYLMMIAGMFLLAGRRARRSLLRV